jgi:hypothetical protein
MTYICCIANVYMQDIKKQLHNKVEPDYKFPGRHIEAQAGLTTQWAGIVELGPDYRGLGRHIPC